MKVDSQKMEHIKPKDCSQTPINATEDNLSASNISQVNAHKHP